ncbi:DMT family transporter [Halomonas campisalis]|uniref:DMT family transporter n=1 Tax=Billgrantia campisalis TaxID=74661 RepID=A0ABS9PBW7_9GAMM|nr:DMT family transporter [Halomonas campisalis]MCG6659247.1 DMT family transporter [Halomonas campisalis]MDR5864246.1 DMT family transporter [Halomonas campisalis]
MTLRTPSLTDVQPLLSSRSQRLLGYGAALGMVLIWSSYFLSLRHGALSPIGQLDMTLFRYAVPGLLLLPLLIQRWSAIRRVHPVWLAGMVLGAGLPFFLLGAIGMGWAPVAQGSTLIPGTAPLFVTLLAVAVFRQPLSRWRRLGLCAVLAGVLCLLWGGQAEGAALGRGQALFLVCSLLWALFTVSMRQSGLSALEAAAVVTVPNGALAVLYLLATATPLTLGSVPGDEWLLQLLVQGVAVGLGSSFLYGFAIRQLGAEITSSIGSLTPVCATLMAWLLLQESITAATALGMALVSLGVVIASGLLQRWAN